jgi:hypothetical protein
MAESSGGVADSQLKARAVLLPDLFASNRTFIRRMKRNLSAGNKTPAQSFDELNARQA